MRLGIFALALLARTAAAQGSVTGTVYDSLAGAPLAGARVQLIGTGSQADFSRSSLSDSLGRFTIAEVPSGRFAIGFFHPITDSIGVLPPLRAVDVGAGAVRVNLAIPSPSRLRAAICGPGTDSSGVLVGTVRNARDQAPTDSAIVSGEWLEVSFEAGAIARRAPHLVANSGDNGWFAMCNVPVGGTMFIRAARGADSTDLIELQVPPSGFARRDLYLGGARTTVSRDSSATDSTVTVRRMRTGTGRIGGVVTALRGNAPLPNAQVRIEDGPGARTNARGEWTIDNAPEGTRILEVRAVGYYPERRAVNVVEEPRPVAVALSNFKAVLDTILVTAQRLNRDSNGFELRRRMSQGRFITPRDIALRNPLFTSDLFRNMPGVRLTLDDNGADRSILIRGAMGDWCTPGLYIDGAYMPGVTAGDLDAIVSTRDVKGIEVHQDATLPPQYNRFDGCGAILIWTR